MSHNSYRYDITTAKATKPSGWWLAVFVCKFPQHVAGSPALLEFQLCLLLVVPVPGTVPGTWYQSGTWCHYQVPGKVPTTIVPATYQVPGTER